jgi:hypothetical protein
LSSAAFAHEEGYYGCAGDGAPGNSTWPRKEISLTGLVSGQVLNRAGRDLNVYLGDAYDGSGFQARMIRAGLCGRIKVPLGSITYALVYEPWDQVESRRIDAYDWGRFTVAEFGWQPLRWLGAYVGIRKILFDFASSEPEQGRSLPLLPAVSRGTAPDRRLGATLDLDFGTVRLAGGAYESARQLGDIPNGGILAAVRAWIEPIGPVGTTLSTVDDDPFWRKRARVGINLSALYEWNPRNQGWGFEGDIPFKMGPLGFVLEYVYGGGMTAVDPSYPLTAHNNRQGLFAQAAVMVLRPWIELEGRYEWQTRPITEDPRGTFHGLTAGLTLYGWKTWVKGQLAYSHRFHYAGVGADDDIALMVLTLAR